MSNAVCGYCGEDHASDTCDAVNPDPEASARWWDHLASKETSSVRASTYRAAAQAIRLGIKTGVPHCACHLRPTKEHAERLTR